jgi:hypothetical protein
MPSLRNTGSAIASTIAAAKPLASGKCRVYFSCFFFSLLASKKSSDPLYFLGVFFFIFWGNWGCFQQNFNFSKVEYFCATKVLNSGKVENTNFSFTRVSRC